MPSKSSIADYPHGRVPRALRAQQLAELAEQLFAERGYGGASMDELARRAGVTKPVIYDLFGNKEGLYRHCVERSAEGLRSAVFEATSAEHEVEAKLRAGCLAFLRFAVDHRVAWDVLFLAPDGRFADQAQAIRARQAALVAALLAEEAAPGVDPTQLDALVSILNGGCEALAGWAFEHPDTPLEHLADLFVALIAPGLRSFS
ncbi:MAG TPA: TetR/AcrR family transcriptional regulator [Thermoleophilaceae bacterium]